MTLYISDAFKCLIIFSTTLLLASCTGFKSEPPIMVQLPGAFPNMPGTERPAVDLEHYWEGFNDPVLNDLVAQAVAQNYTLQAAKEEMLSAAAAMNASQDSLLPQGNVLVAASDQKISPYGGHLPSASPAKITSLATLEATYTVPLFGLYGGIKKQAAGVLGLSQAEQQAAQVAVISQVATTYIDLRAQQQTLYLQNTELAESRHIANLVSIRAQAGVASQLDLARAQNSADEVALKIPETKLIIEEDVDQLASLGGQVTPDMSLKKYRCIPKPLRNLPDFVPGDVLRLRPQIFETEAQVVLDAGNLGIAKADLYPQFTISGSLSLSGGNGFLDPFSGTKIPDKLSLFNAGPSLTVPLLDWAQKYQEAKSAQYSLGASIENYHEAVVEGIQATDTAGAQIIAAKAQLYDAYREDQSAKNALSGSETLYTSGNTDLTTVLDAEQQEEKADQDETDAQAALDTAEVDLYAALGGGLTPAAPPPALQKQLVPFVVTIDH